MKSIKKRFHKRPFNREFNFQYFLDKIRFYQKLIFVKIQAEN